MAAVFLGAEAAKVLDEDLREVHANGARTAGGHKLPDRSDVPIAADRRAQKVRAVTLFFGTCCTDMLHPIQS
jgi:hypothetical protein